MENEKINLQPDTKRLPYETPYLRTNEITLEYSIANSSIQQGWRDSKTVTEEVENNYW